MGSVFGHVFRVVTFGESHGPAIGVVVDGVPAGVAIDESFIKRELERRRFCHLPILNPRCEDEEFQILSGVKDGFTEGTPIAVVIWNKRAISDYYNELWMKPRPGHADLAYYLKFGRFYDHRGGGRASGRETVARIVAGAIAKTVLKQTIGVEVSSHLVELGGVAISREDYTFEDVVKSWEKPLPMVDDEAMKRAIDVLINAVKDGDSVGGIGEVLTTEVPPGLGEPVFDKLKADLAKAVMSIGSAVGVEFGLGFRLARMRGSEANDQIVLRGGRPRLETNRIGGILGGMSIGEPIRFRVAFKPTPSIRKPQRTVDLERMIETTITFRGRYDVSTAPKAILAAEAMTAIVLVDHAMRAGLIPRVVKR
ncbi:chorismate synthase [Vulcanisaeta distributa]|uniref:Chorismate synthase n=1 Tax=Vulcanisaeta distributa (strain DSM 14429 / JCM 11212 / NBRC 100878 / IC-017) TaxID=572478 RepID=E1QT32_VULDI|nr:chorismate synthase [Vulcanisaeta distributa]ADN49624.1 chorismate synthase [Vulcanisaeta distributa DSM 14429]